MTKHKPESEQETVADESTLQTGTSDEAQRTDDQAAAEAIAMQRALDKSALDAQDPIIYRYNGNATAGESMAHVPLADIRQSLWNELEPYMRAGVEASYLYTKAEV